MLLDRAYLYIFKSDSTNALSDRGLSTSQMMRLHKIMCSFVWDHTGVQTTADALFVECLNDYIKCISKYIEIPERNILRIKEFCKVIGDVPKLGAKSAYLQELAHIILNKVVDLETPLWFSKELVINFKLTLRYFSKEFLINFIATKVDFLFKVADALDICGDYTCQFIMLDTIFYMCSPEQISDFSSKLFPESKILQDAFQNIRNDNFIVAVRKFLNLVNKQGTKVFSIRCERALLDGHDIDAPQRCVESDLWLDFNYRSEALSMFCDGNSLESVFPSGKDNGSDLWKLITINTTDVKDVIISRWLDVHYPVSRGSIICFNLKQACIVTFTSQEAIQAKHLKLVISNGSCLEQLEQCVLPKIFKKKITRLSPPRAVAPQKPKIDTTSYDLNSMTLETTPPNHLVGLESNNRTTTNASRILVASNCFNFYEDISDISEDGLSTTEIRNYSDASTHLTGCIVDHIDLTLDGSRSDLSFQSFDARIQNHQDTNAVVCSEKFYSLPENDTITAAINPTSENEEVAQPDCAGAATEYFTANEANFNPSSILQQDEDMQSIIENQPLEKLLAILNASNESAVSLQGSTYCSQEIPMEREVDTSVFVTDGSHFKVDEIGAQVDHMAVDKTHPENQVGVYETDARICFSMTDDEGAEVPILVENNQSFKLPSYANKHLSTIAEIPVKRNYEQIKQTSRKSYQELHENVHVSAGKRCDEIFKQLSKLTDIQLLEKNQDQKENEPRLDFSETSTTNFQGYQKEKRSQENQSVELLSADDGNQKPKPIVSLEGLVHIGLFKSKGNVEKSKPKGRSSNNKKKVSSGQLKGKMKPKGNPVDCVHVGTFDSKDDSKKSEPKAKLAGGKKKISFKGFENKKTKKRRTGQKDQSCVACFRAKGNTRKLTSKAKVPDHEKKTNFEQRDHLGSENSVNSGPTMGIAESKIEVDRLELELEIKQTDRLHTGSRDLLVDLERPTPKTKIAKLNKADRRNQIDMSEPAKEQVPTQLEDTSQTEPPADLNTKISNQGGLLTEKTSQNVEVTLGAEFPAERDQENDWSDDRAHQTLPENLENPKDALKEKSDSRKSPVEVEEQASKTTTELLDQNGNIEVEVVPAEKAIANVERHGASIDTSRGENFLAVTKSFVVQENQQILQETVDNSEKCVVQDLSKSYEDVPTKPPDSEEETLLKENEAIVAQLSPIHTVEKDFSTKALVDIVEKTSLHETGTIMAQAWVLPDQELQKSIIESEEDREKQCSSKENSTYPRMKNDWECANSKEPWVMEIAGNSQKTRRKWKKIIEPDSDDSSGDSISKLNPQVLPEKQFSSHLQQAIIDEILSNKKNVNVILQRENFAKDNQTGMLEINNYQSLSIVGDTSDPKETSDKFLKKTDSLQTIEGTKHTTKNVAADERNITAEGQPNVNTSEQCRPKGNQCMFGQNSPLLSKTYDAKTERIISQSKPSRKRILVEEKECTKPAKRQKRLNSRKLYNPNDLSYTKLFTEDDFDEKTSVYFKSAVGGCMNSTQTIMPRKATKKAESVNFDSKVRMHRGGKKRNEEVNSDGLTVREKAGKARGMTLRKRARKNAQISNETVKNGKKPKKMCNYTSEENLLSWEKEESFEKSILCKRGQKGEKEKKEDAFDKILTSEEKARGKELNYSKKQVNTELVWTDYPQPPGTSSSNFLSMVDALHKRCRAKFVAGLNKSSCQDRGNKSVNRSENKSANRSGNKSANRSGNKSLKSHRVGGMQDEKLSDDSESLYSDGEPCKPATKLKTRKIKATCTKTTRFNSSKLKTPKLLLDKQKSSSSSFLPELCVEKHPELPKIAPEPGLTDSDSILKQTAVESSNPALKIKVLSNIVVKEGFNDCNKESEASAAVDSATVPVEMAFSAPPPSEDVCHLSGSSTVKIPFELLNMEGQNCTENQESKIPCADLSIILESIGSPLGLEVTPSCLGSDSERPVASLAHLAGRKLEPEEILNWIQLGLLKNEVPVYKNILEAIVNPFAAMTKSMLYQLRGPVPTDLIPLYELLEKLDECFDNYAKQS